MIVLSALVLLTYEARVHLSGYVNKQDYRYWIHENPQELISVLSTAKDLTCLLWDRVVWNSWPLLL